MSCKVNLAGSLERCSGDMELLNQVLHPPPSPLPPSSLPASSLASRGAAEANAGSHEQVVDETLQKVKSDQLPQIKQALIDGDMHAAHFATHSIKGASATIGFDSLSHAAKALDDLVQLPCHISGCRSLSAHPSAALLRLPPSCPRKFTLLQRALAHTPSRAESLPRMAQVRVGTQEGAEPLLENLETALDGSLVPCPSPPFTPFLSCPALPLSAPAHLPPS